MVKVSARGQSPVRKRGTAGPSSTAGPRGESAWHGSCGGGGVSFITLPNEEDAMKRFRVVREIAVPVAIALCFAGLSAFSHYASVNLSV